MSEATVPKVAANPWIGFRRPAVNPRMRLIAFPYAGGGASIYHRWLTDLEHEDWLDFVSIQLPGREERMAEPAIEDLDRLLDDLVPGLASLLDLPFAFFGYSMGALIAYELTLRLAERGLSPRCLILAARTPPYQGSPDPSRVLGRDELVAKIRRLGGTPPDLLDSSFFNDHFLPTLQADFTLADSFFRHIPQIVTCPVVAIGAVDDPEVPIERVEAWSTIAGGGFEMKVVSGGHFFLSSAHHELIGIVNGILREENDR